MPAKNHRVILDTNIWIGFLLSRNFSRLDQLLASDKVTLLVSGELLEEVIAVAQRPKFRKYFEISSLTQLLVSLRQKAHWVQVVSEVALCRDVKDNFLLSLALDGQARHLLTGDQDLIVLNPFGETQIMTIADYFAGS